MRNNWRPSAFDLEWTRRNMNMLRCPGGIWGCPAGFSAFIRTGERSCTFDGPLNDGDTFPIELPPDLAKQAMPSCLETNRRIIFVLGVIGWTVIGKNGKRITADPNWSL